MQIFYCPEEGRGRPENLTINYNIYKYMLLNSMYDRMSNGLLLDSNISWMATIKMNATYISSQSFLLPEKDGSSLQLQVSSTLFQISQQLQKQFHTAESSTNLRIKFCFRLQNRWNKRVLVNLNRI